MNTHVKSELASMDLNDACDKLGLPGSMAEYEHMVFIVEDNQLVVCAWNDLKVDDGKEDG